MVHDQLHSFTKWFPTYQKHKKEGLESPLNYVETWHHTPLACFSLNANQFSLKKSFLAEGVKKKWIEWTYPYLTRQSTGTSALNPYFKQYKDLDFIKRSSKNNEIAGRGVFDKWSWEKKGFWSNSFFVKN